MRKIGHQNRMNGRKFGLKSAIILFAFFITQPVALPQSFSIFIPRTPAPAPPIESGWVGVEEPLQKVEKEQAKRKSEAAKIYEIGKALLISA